MVRLLLLTLFVFAGLVGGVSAQPAQPVIPLCGGSPCTTSNPFPVTGTTSAAGTVIGGVSRTKTVCNTPTVTITNSYGVNFVVGGVQSFADAFTSTGTGVLQNVTVTIKALETAGFTFYPFTSAPSAMADAAVAAIAAADVPKVRGPVPLAQAGQLAASGFTVYYGYGLGLALAPVTTALSGVLVTNSTLTTQFAAASDLQICVTTIQDP